ncbi:MAG: ABC transporter permease subunit [Thermoleophilaceae bacterium]
MTWLVRNVDLVSGLLAEHVWLALVPVVVGLALALPLGWAATRVPRVRFALLSAAGLLYTVPSLALFVSLPVVLGTQILSPLNIVVALTLYTVALLVRTVADALDAAPPAVLTAATAMGYRPLRRFVAVELPLAVPVIVAGLRVASVSNISLVTVGSLIGIGGLGELFTLGFQRNFLTPLVVGLVGTLALALVVDAVLVLGGRLATPWVRAGVGT